MANLAVTTARSALGNAPLSPDTSGDNPQATTAGALGNGDGRYPAVAPVTDITRSPVASTPRRRRSIVLRAFPSAPPDYDISTVPATLPGAPARPPAPQANTSATTTTTTIAVPTAAAITTTAAPSGVCALRSALRPASPNSVSSRRSSIIGERASVLERRAAEAQATLEMENQLTGEISGVEEQVLRLERELEGVQIVVESGGSYCGKRGEALASEAERLGKKELLLLQKEVQLREERRMLMRSRCDHQRRAAEVARQRRVMFPDGPEQGRQAQRRVGQTEDSANQRHRVSSGAGSEGAPDSGGSERGLLRDFHDTSAVREEPKLEEDPRLVVRMEAFNLPVLVGTLLSGFALVLFDVATTDLARRLALLAFSLEISSSTVLCWIMFHGQQLYARSTHEERNTRPFLQDMCTAIIVSLTLFSAGVIAFVVSFLVEASDEMEELWLAIFAVILCPTVLAASLFAASAEKFRRGTIQPRRALVVGSQ